MTELLLILKWRPDPAGYLDAVRLRAEVVGPLVEGDTCAQRWRLMSPGARRLAELAIDEVAYVADQAVDSVVTKLLEDCHAC